MLTGIASRLRGRGLSELGLLVAKNVQFAARSLTRSERARRAADRSFDRLWGTNTSGGLSVHDLGIDAERMIHCRRYDPSSEAMLRDPVALLGLDPREFDFVDYGAGKGRMVMVAWGMGFRSATGIELSQRLCDIASRNLARYKFRLGRCSLGGVIQADAASFTPKGRKILAYLYNPFDATIMVEVRQRLEAAMSEGAEQIIVVYTNPEHGFVFADAPGWMVVGSLPGAAIFRADRGTAMSRDTYPQ